MGIWCGGSLVVVLAVVLVAEQEAARSKNVSIGK
jgi:hypothetical protein